MIISSKDRPFDLDPSIKDLTLTDAIEMPPEVLRLKDLRVLRLWHCSMRTLPDDLVNLQNLEVLDISQSQFNELPSAVLHLPQLQVLDITRNQISVLPRQIALLKQLRRLYAAFNLLAALPEEIGELDKLEFLDLTANRLFAIPHRIERLRSLRMLYLGQNSLKLIPPELGLLPKLEVLNLDIAPDTSVPEAILQQGGRSVLTYLRAQLNETARQWLSKLILVGEGGVGKTSLVRSFLGEPFHADEQSTHGVAIRELLLQHPREPQVQMRLRVWDFGGQEIYHATHQFFLTDRSLYLLVWNARLGFEQGKLNYWLDTIRARAPESPIFIIATHVDERLVDFPFSDLQRRYSQIRGFWAVSNVTCEGIAQILEAIRDEATALPLMGQLWPLKWIQAAETLSRLTDRWFSSTQLRKLLLGRGLDEQEQTTLVRWLHELGEVLHFENEAELNDVVILKPEWLTQVISTVLDNRGVADQGGLFTAEDMSVVWADFDVAMRQHLLRLMEKFDLSYRTLEDREISIVVERLRHEPPAEISRIWSDASTHSEVSMKFRFESDIPAGLPTWFVARSHRFTTHNHWRYGALFKEGSHLALVEARGYDRYIRLSVRGSHPHNLFAKLRDGLELTIMRFPGLPVERLVPCPGHDGRLCGHEFELEHLERATQHNPPILEIQCPQSFQMVSVALMLFGINWKVEQGIAGLQKDVRELLELSQREFLNIFRRDQASLDVNCPNVFTLEPVGGLQTLSGASGSAFPNDWLGQSWRLQLYCHAPGRWHSVGEEGAYALHEPSVWIKRALPYLIRLMSILKYSAGVNGGLVVDLRFKEQVAFMDRLLAELPKATKRMTHLSDEPSTNYGSDLRTLHQLLIALDPSQRWGGLQKILTPEGHYFWLCPDHAREYLR